MLSRELLSESHRQREEIVEKLLAKSPDLRPRNAAKNNSFQMKKYYKLILVTVTVLSLFSFIFYKTQYDKLYNVLQVLEFCGSKDTAVNASEMPCSKNSPFLEDFNRRSSDPLPSWKSLHDKLWIYSAYCPEAHCPMAVALALASEDSMDLKELHCRLWHAQSASGVEGIVAYQKLSSGSKNSSLLNAYLLTCENKYPSIVPHGLSFYSNKASVFSQIGGADEHSPSSSISLCLAPQNDYLDSTYAMLENVVWHSLFGVNNFYIYDGGSTKKFLSSMNELGIRSHVTLLPWNLPQGILSPEDKRSILEMDCHMRSAKKFQTFTLLELHQILVPKSTKTLVDEFENFIPKDSKHLKIPLLRFCAEYPEEHEDVSVTALGINMYYAPYSSSISLVHRYRPDEISASQPPKSDESSKEISRNILSVHDYSPCNKLDIDLNSGDTVKDDTIPKKFKSDFIKKYMNLFPHKDL